MKPLQTSSLLKPFLLGCLLFLGFSAFSQDMQPSVNLPVKDGSVVYEKVVEVAGKDKSDIYTRALDWYLKAFPGDKNNLETNDVTIGQLTGESEFDINLKGALGVNLTYNIKCVVTIDCKDNKYRYRFSNFKSTLEGKTESDMFSKYMVNVPIETDLAMAKGEQKASKGQVKTANQRIASIDLKVTDFVDGLNGYINKKAADF